MTIRALIPDFLRRFCRRRFDRCFQRDDLGLCRIGTACTWTVLASRLRPGACVLSGGAGQDISFELELAVRFGCRVAVFDPSPTGRKTFAALAPPPAGLSFYDLGLAAETKAISFSEPADPTEGSFGIIGVGSSAVKFACVSPSAAIDCAGFGTIELLKIDIEGFEYEFLGQMLDEGIRPMQIAVEFHHFLPHIPFRRTFATVRRLQAAGYLIAHKQQCDLLFVHRQALIG